MSELVKSFLDHKGFIKEKGSTNAPIMPNILADSLYLCWEENLKGRLKQEAKMQANRMMAAYRRFNREFFASFDKQQTEACVNAMDEFSEFVDNELKLFRLAIRNRVKKLNAEHKEVISHIAVCNFLSSQANEMWGIIYRKPNGEKDVDDNLKGMQIAARQLLNAYTREIDYKQYRGIDLSDDADVSSAMKRFEARVMEFIRQWK